MSVGRSRVEGFRFSGSGAAGRVGFIRILDSSRGFWPCGGQNRNPLRMTRKCYLCTLLFVRRKHCLFVRICQGSGSRTCQEAGLRLSVDNDRKSTRQADHPTGTLPFGWFFSPLPSPWHRVRSWIQGMEGSPGLSGYCPDGAGVVFSWNRPAREFRRELTSFFSSGVFSFRICRS